MKKLKWRTLAYLDDVVAKDVFADLEKRVEEIEKKLSDKGV